MLELGAEALHGSTLGSSIWVHVIQYVAMQLYQGVCLWASLVEGLYFYLSIHFFSASLLDFVHCSLCHVEPREHFQHSVNTEHCCDF